MTKRRRFHEKFLNLLLLSKNEEYFINENKHIWRMLLLAFDDSYTIYYQNHKFITSEMADLSNDVCYLFLKNANIPWKLK